MAQISQKAFLDPPKRYRPIPFWSWNEKLSVPETRRQIALMDEAGIGGYFMHARGGLQTPYMGEDWMANIAAGIDEARQREMGAWAYDENGWPSGFGDGKVNGLGEQYQQKYLRYEIVDEQARREDGRTIAHLPTEDGRWWHFYYDVNPFYVDTLDAEVARLFLETIHEAYAERFADDLGQAMPGFFTDEPQISRNGIPWSLTLPAAYQQIHGEDLLQLLPELFVETGSYQRTRYRFWHLVQELFVTNFTERLYDWCEEHNCQLTGHMVLEETLLSQITSNSAVMPHFEFFHIPGMDWLGRHINPPTTPLQVSSVAHQLGTRQILSETFALCGWNVSFEELKWIYEWQCVRGITQLCQHLEGYSLRGIRKRDYPPSMFYQEPWWDQYRFFNDYVSRLGLLLAEGEVAFDVLVLHPQSSGWLCYNDADNADIGALNDGFMRVIETMEAAHVPFHLGDERILRRHASVDGNTLAVGTQSYCAVVVPPCRVLSRSTLSLLQTYVQNGGCLVWVGEQPTLVEGEPCEDLTALTRMGTRVNAPRELSQALPATLTTISVADEQGDEIEAIAVTQRKLQALGPLGPCAFYYFVNSDVDHDYVAKLSLPGGGAVRVMLEDGTLQPLAFRAEDGRVTIEHTFPRRGSLALAVTDDAASVADIGSPPATVSELLPARHLAGPWQIELLDDNVLTLDYCDIWIDGELEAEHEHISVVQERCLNRKKPVQLKLRFEVEVAEDWTPEGPLYLVMEQPSLSRIQINSEPVEQRDCGHYRDTSFRKIDIAGRLQSGQNEIILETTFQQRPEVYENLAKARAFEAEKNKLTYDSEIEAIYLVGSFGVQTPGTFEALPRKAMRYRGPFVIGTPPTEADPRDLTPQGLPFFNGTVRLTKRVTLGADEIHHRAFALEDIRGHIVRLKVNGRPIARWFWRPYRADLGDALVPGENVLEIELTGGLRNLLGPHHLQDGESYAVAPPSFYKEPSVFGCAAWDDDYCFVEFGVCLPSE